MRKIILGLVATAAIAAPLALATSAQAVTTTSDASTCVPVTEVTEVNHVEYKYKLKVGTGHIKWSTENVSSMSFGDVEYVRDGNKTQTIIDVAAVDGVNCEIPFPANPLTGLKGISPTAVIPVPAGTEKYTFGPVTNNIRIGGRIATTVTAKPGYVFPGGVTTKSYYATVDNTGYVFLSDPSMRINLPDEFDTPIMAGLWSTKVTVTIVNDTAVDKSLQYELVQEDGRVWVMSATFTDGQPGNVVKAGESRVFTFDAMYNELIASGADVPDDLTFDFGFAA